MKSKSLLIAATLISVFIASSCNNSGKDRERNVVNATIINDDNMKIQMSFDNKNGTATMIFMEDTTVLHQDTTASGIKYSNSVYRYNEWHGEVVLEKDGKVVFTKK
jgi:membrane-bound inhibitor of C-type lysozyme